MRIVCDTNVLVRAALNPNGLAADLLRQIRGSHVLVVSLPLLTEVLEVLRHPKIQVLHGLHERGIRRFVTALYKTAVIALMPRPLPRLVPLDPEDDFVLFTAIAGRADVLTTRDQHLFHPDVLALAASHGLRIIGDEALLAELRGTLKP